MRIIFAGTPEIAAKTLSCLVQWSRDLDLQSQGLNLELVAVYTQPDRPQGRGQKLAASPVKNLALAQHLPIETPLSFNTNSLKNPDAAKNLETFKNYQADLVIVCAYGLILPPAILNTPKYGCWNIHVSLLPKWRGAAPIQRAIEAGDKITGISLMQMDAGLDTGDILLTDTCEILETDTSQTLHEKLANLGPEVLLKGLRLLNQNKLNKIPQDHLNNNLAISYAKKLDKSESLINWHESAFKISCKIRAFNPYPIASSQLGEFHIRIHEAHIHAPIHTDTYTYNPATIGSILQADKQGITVACGPEGKERITLTKIQFPNGKILPAHEAINNRQALFRDYIFLTPPA